MSTLTEYLGLGTFAEDQPERWESRYTVEVPLGQDDLSNYVVLNLWNSGDNLANFGYMSSQGFTTNYNGWYKDDISIFNFGEDDFTVRLQFGFGSYYAYNDLEGQSTIPVLCVGPGQVYDSPFLVAMVNTGTPTNVQKGDLFFSLRDTEDNEAYCYLSSSDWYLPTYASKFHMEVSRRGSVFSLRYNGLYGQKQVNNTFPSFGSLDLTGMTRTYIMSSSITGSVNNGFYGLQVTKGISRTVGPNCIGAYTKTFGYPSKPVIRRRHSEDLLCKNIVIPVLGMIPSPSALAAVADTGSCVNDETASGNVLTNDSGDYLRVTKVSGSVNNVDASVAGSNGGLFSITARGAWTFDPDGDFDDLTSEQTADTSVTYHVSDGVVEASTTLTVTVSSASAPAIPTDSLVVFYKMDAISGTVLTDESGNGHDGYLYGGAVVSGAIDNAIAFNGTTSHGAKTSHLKNLSGGFALSMWVNMSIRTNTYDTIFAMDPLSGSNRLRILNYNGTTTGMLFQFGGTIINNTGGQNPSGKTHILAQYNSTTGLIELYFNNSLIASGTTATGLVTPNLDAYIGKTQSDYSTNKNLSISGWVDQVRFYNRTLTSDERYALYAESA